MSKLRQKRHERGLTLHQVATCIGLAASNLSRIERAQQAPRPAAAIRLYQFFDKEVPLEDIISVDGPAEQSAHEAQPR